MPTQMDTEVSKLVGMGVQQQIPGFMGGKFQQSTSSMGGLYYQDGNSIAGGYGNSTLMREANGYYSEFDGRENAVAVEQFSGFALPESFLGNYYTQVRRRACLVWKIISRVPIRTFSVLGFFLLAPPTH